MRLLVTVLALMALPLMASIRIVATRIGGPPPSSGYYQIPVANQTLWQPGVIQGVPGGIPSGQTHITNAVTHFSADNTGATATHTQIQAAIDACPSNGVVYLPAGTYLLTSQLNGKQGVVLRGAGTNTVLIGSNLTQVITFYWDEGAGYNALPSQHYITGGLTAGSTNITVQWTGANPYNPVAPGYNIMIARWNSTNQYESPLVLSVGSGGVTNTNSMFDISYRSIHRVISTNSNSITFWPPIAGSMVADRTDGGSIGRVSSSVGYELNKKLYRFGVEDLAIHTYGCQKAIYYIGTSECWVKGVTILRKSGTLNYGIQVDWSLWTEIRNCYIDGDQDTSGSNAGGILVGTSSFGLVENNVVKRFFPCIEHNAGVGWIYGYNYLMNTSGLFEISGNHGAHSAMNLYEGNVAGHFISDGYHGSGSHDTLYRNWFHGLYHDTGGPTNQLFGFAIALKRFSRNYVLAGNIVGFGGAYTQTYAGGSYGQPNIGNTNDNGNVAPPWADWGAGGTGPGSWQEYDSGVTNSLTRKGNWNFYDNAIPASESLGGLLLSNSLYRPGKPSWFAASQPWPPFPVESVAVRNVTNIPAGFRELHGFWP